MSLEGKVCSFRNAQQTFEVKIGKGGRFSSSSHRNLTLKEENRLPDLGQRCIAKLGLHFLICKMSLLDNVTLKNPLGKV